jgi:hypothetical protein
MKNPYDDRATPVLIIGIVGLTFCQLVAPAAWVMGSRLKTEAEAAGFPEPGMGKAGRILGIVGSVLMAILVLFMVVMFVAAMATAGTGSS